MKSANFIEKQQMEVKEGPVPVPKANEVVIRVKNCGICGTDQHIYHGHPGSATVHPPIVLGHELSGVVTQVGEGVRHLQKDDRVSIDPNIYCGICEYCRTNRAHLCDHLEAVGVTRDGGMAEYCVVPEKNCYVIPDAMTFEEAALVEPLGCVLHGFKSIELSPLSRVLIIGGGFIGQLFLQLVRSRTVKSVTVSEPVKEKEALLLSLGADKVVNPLESPDTHDRFDVVIECVGRKDSMGMAVSAARKGGQILLFGVAAPETQIAISPFEIFSKELTIKGSFINPYTHDEAMSFIQNKVVDVASLISHRFTIDEIPEIMAKYPQLKVSKGIIGF
jgi:L-iditol 2-dehydrogenase